MCSINSLLSDSKTSIEMLRHMRIPRRFYDVSFKKIQEGGHKEKIREFIQERNQVREKGGGLVLFGDNGTGKTSAAIVLMREMRSLRGRGESGFFIRTAQYISQVMSKETIGNERSLVEYCAEVTYLILDDLGKEPTGQNSLGGGEGMIEDLLRMRSDVSRPTFITTNMGMKEVRERYGDSLLEMMVANFELVETSGKSMREKQNIQTKE